MIYFLIILLIAVLSYREVQILIDRGSWKEKDHPKIFWYIEQKGFKRLWDSLHVSNGIITMIICYIIAEYVVEFQILFLGDYQTAVLTVVGWVVFMQIRNLFMEIM